jgi:hypothetical protein
MRLERSGVASAYMHDRLAILPSLALLVHIVAGRMLEDLVDHVLLFLFLFLFLVVADAVVVHHDASMLRNDRARSRSRSQPSRPSRATDTGSNSGCAPTEDSPRNGDRRMASPETEEERGKTGRP